MSAQAATIDEAWAQQLSADPDSASRSALMRRIAFLMKNEAPAAAVVDAVPIRRLLVNRCNLLGCTFVDDGQPIDAETVMSPEMFLPAIAWNAQEGGMALLGEDLGCVLRREPRSRFGAVVSVPPLTGHIVDVIRYLFFQHYTERMFGLRPGLQIDVYPTFETLRRGFADMLQAQHLSPEGEIQWPYQTPAPSPRH